MDSEDSLRILWANVLYRAIDDAEGRVIGDETKEILLAKEWLLHDEEDFPDVCIMAGFDPKEVRKIARKRLNEGN